MLGDIHRAEAYCKKLGSQEAYLGLLDLLLHPADGREPLYADACHLLAAQGVYKACCTRRVYTPSTTCSKVEFPDLDATIQCACHVPDDLRVHVRG